MSRQFRYRMAALGLSALIFGVPLLTNGTASAEQLEGNDRQVSFGGGGMLGLSCGSKPSVESMTVPASSVVRVVNQTGHDAQLKLAGSPKGTIPADGTAEVVFRRGTTEVLLTPDCPLDENPVPMLVTATTPADSTAQSDPAPAPTDGNGAGVTMAKPAGPGSPAHSRTFGSTLPDGLAPHSRPDRTSPKSARPGDRHPSDPRPATAMRNVNIAAQALPQGGVAPRIKDKIIRGTGIGAPAFAGMPPGDRRTILPDAVTAPRPPAREDVAPPTMAGAGAPATDTAGTGSFAAAEPIAAVGRIDEGHPLGLLGLTALVCVLGVATAAIRAIASQRASRTNMV
ncbi:hypothetical protein KZ829_30260 [Actinoplanes hulinensis]|uniref:Uncharacterized protein n=1 Tax=Actinoplanes hulinensis TaxID=1144547 RepID=A0ABS7BC62_9ACTN|nr:hypothetical protein [Actinoplanes hulinensis]MBW6438024.1 hypothetical protein [Actinoplanes hulinensis]